MKILIAGLGSIGQRHLRNILEVLGDSVSIAAYRVRRDSRVVSKTLSIEEGITLKEKYPFEEFTDLDKALEWKPDAVFICNPSSLHVPVALKAAKAGCHLFIEKPLSHSLEGLEELEKTIQEKGLTSFVAFQLRFHPCYLKLKELIEQKAVGNILSVQAEVGEYLPDWHKWEDYREMYASRSDQGGGVVLTQIHEIDYLLSLFGNPKSVYALGGQLSSLEVDVEDSVDIAFENQYENRLLPMLLHMDYCQKPPSRMCRVIGEEGILLLDFPKSHVIKMDREGNQEVFDFNNFERNQLFLDELNHFFDCIKDKKETLIPVSKAIEGMRVAVAIKESIAKKEKINLEALFV